MSLSETSSVSSPVPPDTLSTPPVVTNRSFPAPPMRESLPPSPTSKSERAEPVIVSSPLVPRIPIKPSDKSSTFAAPAVSILSIRPAEPFIFPLNASNCAWVNAILVELACKSSKLVMAALDKSTAPPKTLNVSEPSPPSKLSRTMLSPEITTTSLPAPASTVS